MAVPLFKTIGHGIHCIDALYTAPGIACCYLMVEGDECALIETGTSRTVENILATLSALSIDRSQLRYVIPTHVHLDHAGGAGSLVAQFPNAELLIHPRGARHMIDPGRLIASSEQVYGKQLFAELYGDIIPVEAARVRELTDGETVLLGKRELQVLHTRGHAEHHFCLFDTRSRGWFSGDMFGVSYARQRYPGGSFLMPATTPTQFDPGLYQASAQELARAQPASFYLTHYGALPFEPSQLDRLLRQLDAYAALGRSFDGDLKDLEAQVLRITRRELERLLPPNEATAESDSLRMDAALNAQGIAWWSKQRAAV